MCSKAVSLLVYKELETSLSLDARLHFIKRRKVVAMSEVGSKRSRTGTS